MTTRMLLVSVGMALLATSACAQGAQETASSTPATKADLDAFATRIENMVTEKLQQSEQRLNDRLTRLEMQVQVLSDYRQEDQTVLRQIAQKDAEGRSFLRIDASHEPMKQELRRAITEVTPEEGTVIVHNTMDTLQSVAVNGEMYDVFPKSRRSISGVKYGEFRVQVRGKPEQTRNFRFPNTEVEVTIVPETRPTPWVSSTPVYYTYVW